MIRPQEYIHPEDARALRELESIPGFPALVRKVLSLGWETLQYGINMATSIRLSPTQLPELYNLLPPICEKLGISEPELYLQMSPEPNAWTFGDTKIYITITSALVEMMNEEEIKATIAHECGHIACHHVLYHNLASMILKGSGKFLGMLTMPLEFALLYWQRKSELSCDRAASLVTSPQTVTSMMARFAGGPKNLTANVNMEEWARQADQYDAICNDGIWNKTLQMAAISGMSHPFTAVRVREILRWSQSEAYRNIVSGLNAAAIGHICPNCHRPVMEVWRFCNYCGTQL